MALTSMTSSLAGLGVGNGRLARIAKRADNQNVSVASHGFPRGLSWIVDILNVLGVPASCGGASRGLLKTGMRSIDFAARLISPVGRLTAFHASIYMIYRFCQDVQLTIPNSLTLSNPLSLSFSRWLSHH